MAAAADALPVLHAHPAHAAGGGDVDAGVPMPASSMCVPNSLKTWHNAVLRSRGYDDDTVDGVACVYLPSRAALSDDDGAAGPSRHYRTDVISAVVRGDEALIDRLLATRQLDCNAQNEYGVTLLHRASRAGQAGVVRALLRHGAHARCADDAGRTPMHDCVWMGPFFPVAQALLDWDESLLRVADRFGATPLDYARPASFEAWVAFLTSRVDVWWHPVNAPGKHWSEWSRKLWRTPSPTTLADGAAVAHGCAMTDA